MMMTRMMMMIMTMMILQTCSRQDFQEGGQVLLQVPAAEQVSAQEPAEGRRQGGHREGDQRPDHLLRQRGDQAQEPRQPLQGGHRRAAGGFHVLSI